MFANDDKTYRSIVPRTKGLSPKDAFHAWMEAGSLPRASRYLKKNGVYNHHTGKPFTGFGIRHAACRYIATNHEEARPVLVSAWLNEGVTISNEEWNIFVVETATEYLSSSKTRFVRWLEANPFAYKYDYIYARKYGIEPKSRPTV